MRTTIPFIALSLSAFLLLGCPDDPPGDPDGGTGASGGDGSAGTDGGTAGSGGDGTAGSGGNGTAGSGGDGNGGSVGDACGAGTACSSDDGDSGDWCIANECGDSDNLLYAFCNDSGDNPNADGDFACGCFTGACSRTPENDCFAPTDCTPGPDANSFCLSVCESECGGANQVRDHFCAQTGADTGFCECACLDGTGTCFDT